VQRSLTARNLKTSMPLVEIKVLAGKLSKEYDYLYFFQTRFSVFIATIGGQAPNSLRACCAL
jgi:hypothetical protein